MVDVLAFLFENFLHRPIDLQANMAQIARELPKVGFDLDEIDGAIGWLNQTIKNQHFASPFLKDCHSSRVFSPQEIAKLDSEARGMIYFLETNGLITPAVRELLIERAMALNINSVGKEQMRWVVLFVMMNTHARNDVIEWIEASIKKAMQAK